MESSAPSLCVLLAVRPVPSSAPAPCVPPSGASSVPTGWSGAEGQGGASHLYQNAYKIFGNHPLVHYIQAVLTRAWHCLKGRDVSRTEERLLPPTQWLSVASHTSQGEVHCRAPQHCFLGVWPGHLVTFAGPVSQECWSSSDDLFLICLKWRQSGLERSLSEAAAVTACSFCLTVHASLSRTQELLKAAVCYIREVTHALKKKPTTLRALLCTYLNKRSQNLSETCLGNMLCSG